MNKQFQKTTKKVFVFSAHPDDHLCCAGTLMFLKEKGFEIFEIVATGGEKGSWWVSETKKKRGFKKEELKKERERELNKASKIIGISQTSFLGLPDGEVVMNFKIVEKIIEFIRKEKPALVLTINPIDYHQDHRELTKIVLEGLTRSSRSFCSKLGKPYKVPIVLFMEEFPFGKAHFIIDVTPFIKKKKKVFDIYKSQINSRKKKFLESINFYRAFLTRNDKVWAAESFEIPSEFPVQLNQLIKFFESNNSN